MQLFFTLLSIWVIGSTAGATAQQMTPQMMAAMASGNPQLAAAMTNANPQMMGQMSQLNVQMAGQMAAQQQSATNPAGSAPDTASPVVPAAMVSANVPDTQTQVAATPSGQTLSGPQALAAAGASMPSGGSTGSQTLSAQQALAAASMASGGSTVSAPAAGASMPSGGSTGSQTLSAQQALAAASMASGGSTQQMTPQLAAAMANANPQMMGQMSQLNVQMAGQMAAQQQSATNPTPSSPQTVGSAGGSTLSGPQAIAAAEASMASGGSTGSQTPTCTSGAGAQQAAMAASLRTNCVNNYGAHLRRTVFCNGFVAWNMAQTVWNGVSMLGAAPGNSGCPLSQSVDIKIVSAIHGMYAPAGGMDAVAVTFNYPILPASTFTMPGSTCPSGYLPPLLFTVDGVSVTSATAQPATDDGEWSTVVLMGNFGGDLAGKLVSVTALDFVTPGGCTKATQLTGPISYNIKLVSAKLTSFASCQYGLDIISQGGFEHEDGSHVVATDFELVGAPSSIFLEEPTGAEADENADNDNYFKACLGGLTSPLQLQSAKLGVKSCSGSNALYPPNGIHPCSSDDPVDIVLPTMPTNAGRR